jgi:hypothetical protein
VAVYYIFEQTPVRAQRQPERDGPHDDGRQRDPTQTAQ